MVSEFTTLYAPGPAFAAGRRLQDQEGFRDQVAWWKEHEAAGKMKLVGVPALSPDSVLVVGYADSFEAAHALALSAPAVASGILTARTMTGGMPRCVPPSG